ncbi:MULTISPECIES: hypothetical protein [Salinibaculum]|uniref:hypothetical protein n=1 Tax=Salinibaculum TaxID=2732368 RepID=UPI0030CE2EAE
MDRRLAWVLAAAVGGLAGGLSYTVGAPDPSLTAGVVLSYGAVVVLSARHPDTVYQEGVGRVGFRYGFWSAAATAFLLLVALLGVGPWVPVDAGLRVSLGLFVLGAGYAMWLFGVSYARAKGDGGA